MGVNAHIYLPSDVRIKDVAIVIGAMAGLPVCFVPFDKRFPGKGYAQADGVSIETSHTPSMAIINLVVKKEHGAMVDGENWHEAYFHFEDPTGMHCVSVKSTPFWIAVGRGLTKFFGGKMSYMDVDNKINFTAKKPRKSNSPEDGRPWDEFQRTMLGVKELTKKDLQAARKFAAYRPDPSEEV